MSLDAFEATYEDITIFKFSSGTSSINLKNRMSIIPQVVEVNMFESIFSPVIRAELLINDSIGLFVNFPLTGEEIIKVSYKAPDGNIRTNWMIIEKISDIAISDDSRTMVYVMSCISIEAWQNARTNVQKALNATAATAIETLFEDYISTPIRQTFPFIGNRDDNTFYNFAPAGADSQVWVIPNISPFHAINMLSKKIISNNDKSYSYIFYQNRYGYNLRSIQDMFDKDNSNGFRSKATENKYKYMSNEVDDGDSKLNNDNRIVTAISFNKRLSSLEKISMGYFQNKLFEINPAQKAYNIWEEETPDKATFLETNILDTQAHKNAVPIQGDEEQANMVRYTINNRSENDIDQPVEQTRNRWGKDVISQIAMSQVDITVTIPADNNFAVGELFYMETPVVHGFNRNEEDELISGLYIITQKRDTIIQDGTMSTNLTLQKDSYKKSVDYDSKYVEDRGDDSFIRV